MITDFEYYRERWGKVGWVIRQSWKYDGKPVKLVVLAKNGARYVPPSSRRMTRWWAI